MRSILVEAWDEQAFSDFGCPIRHRGTAPLEDLSQVFESGTKATQPYCGLLTIDVATTLPHIVTRLERHPFSAQSFVPLVNGLCLAIVCPSLIDGAPDISGLRAFAIEPPLGITYRRNVWHHSVLALSVPSQLLVIMRRTGLEDDNIFWTLENAIEVKLAAFLI